MRILRPTVFSEGDRPHPPIFIQENSAAIGPDKKKAFVFPKGPYTNARQVQKSIEPVIERIVAKKAITGSDGQQSRAQFQHGKGYITADISHGIPVTVFDIGSANLSYADSIRCKEIALRKCKSFGNR